MITQFFLLQRILIPHGTNTGTYKLFINEILNYANKSWTI